MRVGLAVASVVLATVVAGCGGGDPVGQGSSGSAPAASATSPAPFSRAVVKASSGSVEVFAAPDGKVVHRLPVRTTYGSTRVFLVRKVEGGWVQVDLPVRPNGSTGWVRASQVRVEDVRDVVEINLSARTVTASVQGKVATSKAAIGTADNPTPKGRFYITDLVVPPDPKGAYGALALGLSAHSETLQEFGKGDGQAAIHGTNDPASIGKAVSHGCVRVPDPMVTFLKQVKLGTPVIIS